jgi:hypothetical protein
VVILIFVGIFLFNLAPAFTPPTWMVLSYIEVVHHPNHLVLALVGAVAATCGRLLLARGSTVLVRNRCLSVRTIGNVNVITEQLRQHQTLTFGIFLFYAFSPLPSNQLFIAYGLTGLGLKLIAVPFFLGRLVSYSFWIFTASEVSERLAVESLTTRRFFGAYFVVVQILTLAMVFVFTRIDWSAFVRERRLRWLR